MSAKILVAAPTSRLKDYAFDEYSQQLRSFEYMNYDTYMVDNSTDPEYVKTIWEAGIDADHIEPGGSPIEYVTLSQNMIRKRAIEGGYDWLLMLESDVFVPPNILSYLMMHGNEVHTFPYFILNGSETTLCLQGITSRVSYQRAMRLDPVTSMAMFTGEVKPINEYKIGCDIELYATGIGCCFPPETNILDANRNIKKIKDVKVGDAVLTHDGCEEKVINISSRKHEGKMIGITPKYFRKTISMTPNHPILIIKKEELKTKRGDYIKGKKLDPIFIDAQDIRDGDFVCYPKNRILETKKESINVSDHVVMRGNIRIEGGLIFSNKSHSSIRAVSITKISSKYKICRGSISKAILWHKEGKKPDFYISEKQKDKVVGILIKEGFDFEYSCLKLNNTIKIDSDFCEFYGYYIAEGSSSNGNVEFSFGGTEIGYANRIKELTQKIFGLKSKVSKRKNQNVIRVVISSSILAEFMISVSGCGASNKEIVLLKELIRSGKDNIKSFLNAYVNGDGHVRKEFTSMTTVSEKLAHNLKELWLLLGKVPTVRCIMPTGREKINGRSVCCRPAYVVIVYNNQKSFYEDGQYFYLPVKVSKSDYDGMVYNLQVANKETYCIESFAVHNCFIHRRVFEQFEFRINKNAPHIFSDSYFYRDLRAKKQTVILDTTFIPVHKRSDSWVTDRRLIG